MTFREGPPGRELERARDLVERFGWNTTCFQILNPGIRRSFGDDGGSVVGFVERRRVWVVAGAPVCPLDRLVETMTAFEAAAAEAHSRVCYFGAEARVMNAADGLARYSRVVLGAQPSWRPKEWAEHRFRPSVREQFARARAKGVRVGERPAALAERDPDIERILGEWLRTRGLPTMHFLVEPHVLDDLRGRRVFVAEQAGRSVAFLILAPIPDRGGWLTEHFIRGRDAPNGTVELLVDAAVRAIADDGAEFVTMGIVPLSPHAEAQARENPAWLRVLLAAIRAHGRRFYNFAGLDYFKDKFEPDAWEAIYAVANEANFSVGTLYAVAAAFSDGPPWLAAAKGAGKALAQEAAWLLPRSAAGRTAPYV